MAEESPEKETRAERVGRSGMKKSSLRLPRHSAKDWPANLGELLEWYSHEVTDVNRAAEMRVQDATRFVTACLSGEITLEEAGERVNAHSRQWRDVFPGGVNWVRGMSDEEIRNTMDERIRQDRERPR